MTFIKELISGLAIAVILLAVWLISSFIPPPGTGKNKNQTLF